MKLYFETELGKLYHGDCMEIMPELEPVDLIFADPPYFVNYKYGDKLDTEFEYIEPMQLTDLCLWKADTFLVTPGMGQLRKYYEQDPVWTYCWLKPGSTRRSKLKGFNTWEPVLIFGDIKNPIWQDHVILPDCINHAKDSGDHPCPKPTALLMKLICEFKPDTVMDPFAGSGTTAIVCERLNRRWTGIEISEEYCEITAKRIERENLQLKMF